MTSDMKDAIKAYCGAGWRLFPMRGGERRPHIKNFLQSASNDVHKVLEWLGRWPDMGIGVAARNSGLIVIDIDRRSNGFESRLELSRQGRAFRKTLTAGTPRHGLHLYYQSPPGMTHARGKFGAHAGIDVLWNHGVPLPPSHNQHGSYTWIDGRSAIAPLPGWAREIVEYVPDVISDTRRMAALAGGSDARVGRKADGIEGHLSSQGSGNRAMAMHWSACRMFEIVKAGRMSVEEAIQRLERSAPVGRDYTLKEARASIRDAQRKVLR